MSICYETHRKEWLAEITEFESIRKEQSNRATAAALGRLKRVEKRFSEGEKYLRAIAGALQHNSELDESFMAPFSGARAALETHGLMGQAMAGAEPRGWVLRSPPLALTLLRVHGGLYRLGDRGRKYSEDTRALIFHCQQLSDECVPLYCMRCSFCISGFSLLK